MTSTLHGALWCELSSVGLENDEYCSYTSSDEQDDYWENELHDKIVYSMLKWCFSYLCLGEVLRRFRRRLDQAVTFKSATERKI